MSLIFFRKFGLRGLQQNEAFFKQLGSINKFYFENSKREISFSSLTCSAEKSFSRSTSTISKVARIQDHPLITKSLLEDKPEPDDEFQLRARIGGTANAPSRSEILEDFKYRFVTAVNQENIQDRFKDVDAKDRPLVLLFGWAGATQKNLAKYSKIYHKAGCTTLGYNLPGRFVFIDTSEVPIISNELIKVMESAILEKRPLFFHIMSDTGLMVLQGLEIVARQQRKQLNITGVVLDSCPGPRPKGTLTRLTVYGIVNWFCSRAEGHDMSRRFKETMRYIQHRFIPSFKRYFQGLPVELSMMDNKWAGDYYRDATNKPWPELFLYSKSDGYLPWKYLEEEVLKPRREVGRDFRVKCWKKSGHVAHLRANPKEYENEVLDFIYDKHFKNLKKK